MRRPTAGLIATVSAILVYFIAAGIEILLIERLQPTEVELTWISDGILAFAFGSALFLWLHLTSTRLTLSHLEREHIVLETQLTLAAGIQRGLLPSVPSDAEGVRWAARLEQAGRIGGDLYDFVRTDARSWLVLVGDVSGKGIPAALVLASIRTMFRMMTRDTSDPAQLVERISQRLYEDHGGMPYFTCVIVKINLDTHELAYVNAGHPPGLVLDVSDQKRTPLLLESCGPPAGMFAGQKYQDELALSSARSDVDTRHGRHHRSVRRVGRIGGRSDRIACRTDATSTGPGSCLRCADRANRRSPYERRLARRPDRSRLRGGRRIVVKTRRYVRSR